MGKIQERLARKAADKEDLGLDPEEPEKLTGTQEYENQAGEEIGPNDEVPESTVGAQQVKPGAAKSLSDDPPPLTGREKQSKVIKIQADKDAAIYKAEKEAEAKSEKSKGDK